MRKSEHTCGLLSLTDSGSNSASFARQGHSRRFVRSVAAKKAAWPTGTCAALKWLAVNRATCLGLSSLWRRRAVCGSTSLSHRERYCQSLRGAHQATPCPTKRAGRVTAVCAQGLSTETAQPSRGKTRTSELRAGFWWHSRQLGSPSRSPERCRTSSKMSTGRNFLPSSCSFELRARAGATRHGQQLRGTRRKPSLAESH